MARLEKYRFRFALVVCISLLSVFILFPVQAEDRASVKVPVVLDGRELLEVGALGKLTAQERATFITSNLESALANSIERGRPPEVKVVRSNQNLVLKVDSHPLVEVTEDTFNSMYSGMQAQVWQEQLQQGLEQSWRERTPAYTRWAVKMLTIAFLTTLLLQRGLVLLFRYVRR